MGKPMKQHVISICLAVMLIVTGCGQSNAGDDPTNLEDGPSEVLYQDLMNKESEDPVVSGDQVAINWIRLADRTVEAERFLNEFPGSVHFDEVKGLYLQYLRILLNGYGNTGVFESRGQFRANVQQGFDALLSEHPDSFTAGVVWTFIDLIRQSAKHPPTSDNPANDPVHIEIGKYLDSLPLKIGERFSN